MRAKELACGATTEHNQSWAFRPKTFDACQGGVTVTDWQSAFARHRLQFDGEFEQAIDGHLIRGMTCEAACMLCLAPQLLRCCTRCSRQFGTRAWHPAEHPSPASKIAAARMRCQVTRRRGSARPSTNGGAVRKRVGARSLRTGCQSPPACRSARPAPRPSSQQCSSRSSR
jgi:hypothetical protein